MDILNGKNIVIGLKQSKRAITENRAECVFLALDADKHITDLVADMCKNSNIPVQFVHTMKELGESCGIDVGCAVAAVLKAQ